MLSLLANKLFALKFMMVERSFIHMIQSMRLNQNPYWIHPFVSLMRKITQIIY